MTGSTGPIPIGARNSSGVAQGIAMGFRVAMGALFIFAAKHKIEAPAEFLEVVYNYRLVGPKAGLWVATLLPALEVVLGACLIAGVMKLFSAFLATTLAGVFLFAQASALARGLSIDCGCFGLEAGSTIGWASIARTALILVGALSLLVLTILLENRGGIRRSSSSVTDDSVILLSNGRPV